LSVGEAGISSLCDAKGRGVFFGVGKRYEDPGRASVFYVYHGASVAGVSYAYVPVRKPARAGGKGLPNRFFGGKAHGVMLRGIFFAATVEDFVVGINFSQKITVAGETLDSGYVDDIYPDAFHHKSR
jgi:hypothetical protein